MLNNRAARNLLPYVFMLPALLFIAAVILVPFIGNIGLSLTNFDGFSSKFKFIGLENYTRMVTDQYVHGALFNTLKYVIIIVVLQNFIALVLALALFNTKKLSNFFRTIIFLPTVIATVAVAFIWNTILTPEVGWFSYIGKALNIGFLAEMNIFGNVDQALFGISAANIWQWTGWCMVVFFAGLQSVPRELLESADTDGASGFKRLIYITLPMLAPAFTINIVYSTIGTLKIFDLPYIITGGGPARSTETLTILMNEIAFRNNEMGYGSAIAFALFFIIFLISSIQTNYLRKAEGEIN